MRNLRSFAALFLAFGSLLFATPAHATTLEEAQTQLLAAQQEVIDATQAVADAQTAYDAAHAAKLATAIEHPEVITSGTGNVVLNGDFHDASAWSGITMYEESMYNNFSSAVVINGTLKGSYSSGNFYMQQGTFASPVRQVTFSVDVLNNDNNREIADYYRIEFRTYDANGTRLNYYNFQYGGAFHDWVTRGATYTLAADAVRWDVGFRLADGGGWNGNYGPAIDNVQVIAPTQTITPAWTEYAQAETDAEALALSALTAAQSRLSTANAEVVRLTQLVQDLTPVEPNWWAGQADEGWTETYTAPAGWEFYSVRFWYGGVDGVCGIDVSNVIGPLMIGFNTATITLDNALLTDPCPGTPKVIRYTWSIVLSQPVAPVEPTPEPTPQPTVEPTPTPTVDPQPPVVVELTPTPEPSPVPSPIPTTEPTPEPTPTPSPAPSPSPLPQPEPAPQPQPQPQPEPQPLPVEPTPTPEVPTTPEPTPSPEVTPSPEPTPEPTPTETPEPEVVPEPEPTEEPLSPSPEPEVTEEPLPEPTPEPSPQPELTPEPTPLEETVALIDELTTIAPEDLTDAQVEQLVEAAMETFETAEQGSPEYQAALEALAVAADADDPEIPAELAAIPVLGEALGAALEVFNDLGNFGADMAPEVREAAEKVVVSAIIVTQVATSAAVSAAVASASAPSASSRRIK